MVFILFSFVNVYLRILAFGTKFSALNYAAELPLRHSRVCESEKEPKSQGRRCQIQAEPYSITLWPSQLGKIIEKRFSSTASCVRHNQIRTLLLNQGLHRRRGVHHQERQHRHRLGGRLGLHRQPDGRFESAAAKSIGSRRITT